MSSRALRRLQNDDELLKSLVNSATVKNGNQTQTKRQTAVSNNVFALISEKDGGDDSDTSVDLNNEESGDELTKNNVTQLDKRENIVVSIATKSQKNKKKKNKKKQQKKAKSPMKDYGSDGDGEDDEEFEQILKEYQHKNVLQNAKHNRTFGGDDDEFYSANEVDETQRKKSYMKNIDADLGFHSFPFSEFDDLKWAFNQDFEKLDAHTEFKLLFNDISAKSLDDIDSMTSTPISPQQVKQIQRLKRLVKNWGGKDHRNVPNGPGGSVHRLQFTKVFDDWIPTSRGELKMNLMTEEEILNWQLWQRPLDWKDSIKEDINYWRKHISFYKFDPSNVELNRKGLTEFYMSVILHPDHEALISMVSKFPYHIPGLLQVALITIRQGDRSNTNGLIQRALFVFDRALKTGLHFNGSQIQLPYTYFYNRQFYLAIFRYIQMLAQRGAVGTASEWAKVLWSLSPLEDPLGCRYFIDHYLLLNNEYAYLAKLANSPLLICYRQWYTLGLSLAIALSHWKVGEETQAKEELKKAFKYHTNALAYLFEETLQGDKFLTGNLASRISEQEFIEVKAYAVRFKIIWKDSKDLNFLLTELKNLFQLLKEGKMETVKETLDDDDLEVHPFKTSGLPKNLLRFVILSDESSVIATIPERIWSENQLYEFDILPPEPTTKDSRDAVEAVTSFVKQSDLTNAQVELMQDESILNQIRQMSLEQFLEENPNAEIE